MTTNPTRVLKVTQQFDSGRWKLRLELIPSPAQEGFHSFTAQEVPERQALCQYFLSFERLAENLRDHLRLR